MMPFVNKPFRDMPFLIILLICCSIATCRPPTSTDHRHVESAENLDYFDNFFPAFVNSTKLNENLQFEKKKYLTSLLGIGEKLSKF